MCIQGGQWSSVDYGQEVSWNGSWYTDPLGALNSLFVVRWRTMWSLRKSKMSLVYFCLSVSCGSLWPDFT